MACKFNSLPPGRGDGDEDDDKQAKPIDKGDRIDDWLYLPETLYAFMLIIIVSAGAGPYSLDALILGLMNKHVA